MKMILIMMTLLLAIACGKSGSGGSSSSASNSPLSISSNPQTQSLIATLSATGVQFVDNGDKVSIVCNNNYSITNAQRITSLTNLKSVVMQSSQTTFDFQYARLYPFQMETLILSAISSLQYAGYYSNACPANIIGQLDY